MLRIGSLFSGSGGFELAAAICGIKPTWASEVEPFPIRVTTKRFPNMKHLGDISKVKGNEIEPVDVITFGSPCQDLSVAGKRKGLNHSELGDEETTRSGLFMEAVRIIREMKEATNGQYPTFAVWENVPGAYSSNKGEDFRIVLEELEKTASGDTVHIPEPPKGKWLNAGEIVGDNYSIAWRTLDAQYWGVPQRRRRIYLVADFRGQRAGKILFEREGLRGNFTQSRTQGQGTAGNAENGIGAADREECYGFPLGFRPENTRIYEECATTLCNGTRAGFCNGVVIAKRDIKRLEGKILTAELGIASRDGGHCYENIAGTLRANAGDNQLSVVYAVENHPADSRVNIDDSGKVQTLTSRMGTGGGNVPLVMEPKVFENHSQDTRYKGPLEVAQTVSATYGMGGNNQPFVVEEKPVYCLQGNGIDRADTAGCNGKGWKEDTSYTLNTNAQYDIGVDDSGIAHTLVAKGPGAVCYWNGEQVCGTLTANNAGGGQRMLDKDNFNCIIQLASGKDVAGCLMASGYEKLGAQEMFSGDYTVIEGFDGYNSTLTGEKESTLGVNCGMSTGRNGVCCGEPHYIVRRLTPLECCRLQGFPDWWCDGLETPEPTEKDLEFWREVFETHRTVISGTSKPKTDKQIIKWLKDPYSDSAIYKMWGNGICLQNALYVMQGIAEELCKK